MNCFNHPMETATATCQDCQKGLCQECAIQYEFPICVTCNNSRIKNEKIGFIKYYSISLVVGLVLGSFLANHRTNFLDILLAYYYAFSIPIGWKFFNKGLVALLGDRFVSMPIIFWFAFYLVKLLVAMVIGPFILPYKLYVDIKRFIELRKIE